MPAADCKLQGLIEEFGGLAPLAVSSSRLPTTISRDALLAAASLPLLPNQDATADRLGRAMNGKRAPYLAEGVSMHDALVLGW